MFKVTDPNQSFSVNREQDVGYSEKEFVIILSQSLGWVSGGRMGDCDGAKYFNMFGPQVPRV